MRYFALMAGFAVLCSCGGQPADTANDLNSRELKLPGGQTLQVETVMDTMGMLRGLAFRPSLAPNRGMLFAHRTQGKYSYWMFQTLIPLDIIWIDSTHQIVEIVESAPPCKSEASKCAHYGGKANAKYVLEIGGGLSRKYGLKVGDSINF